MLAGCGRGRTVLWARPVDPDRRRRQCAVGCAQRDERPRALFRRRRWYQLAGRAQSESLGHGVKTKGVIFLSGTRAAQRLL